MFAEVFANTRSMILLSMVQRTPLFFASPSARITALFSHCWLRRLWAPAGPTAYSESTALSLGCDGVLVDHVFHLMLDVRR